MLEQCRTIALNCSARRVFIPFIAPQSAGVVPKPFLALETQLARLNN